MKLLDSYKERLKQLKSGQAELYKGELDQIKTTIAAIEKSKRE